MADIRAHAWLCSVKPDKSVIACTTHYDNGRPILNKDQHEAVMSTMKKGGFTAAAVQEAFRGRTYDYITSTYCLLAEREVQLSCQSTAANRSQHVVAFRFVAQAASVSPRPR